MGAIRGEADFDPPASSFHPVATETPMRSTSTARMTAVGVPMPCAKIAGCRPAERSPRMPGRAALITGASSGIGLAIAQMLGEEGHGLTVAARRPEKLEGAAQALRDAGHEVEVVAASLTEEDEVRKVAERHRERFGRLDVLVNNAGVGFGAPVAEIVTKRLDMQLNLNLRSIVLFYRECADMLRAAGAEHRNALVVNTASIAGKSGQAWLSVYSATKAGVIGYTQAMNRELANDGIKSVAL